VRVADSGVPFRMPNGPEREQRLTVVLHVLYLIFTEGYAATAGPGLFRADLLEMDGQHRAARTAYQAAAQRTMSLPHQRYLNARAARLDEHR
jgi:predicted RNA polymerase sigma factor